MINLVITVLVSLFQTSIYTYSVDGIGGSEINFNNFQNKKILIVNIATNSQRVSQLGELQQLHQQYGDSLVIIGFPSNSFNNESRSNNEIQQFCQSQYGVSFLLAAKGSVKGEDIQPVYQWLITKAQNGVFSNEIQGDFQKFLLDKNGNPIGVYSGYLSPLSSRLLNAITGSQN